MGIERLGDTALFRFAVGELQEQELRVLRFRGSEGISQLFDVDFEFVSEDPAIDFKRVVGQPAAFIIDLGEEPRYWNGVMSSFEQGSIGKRFTRYYGQMVPRVWMLNHRVDSRIFQGESVPQIVKSVLDTAGIPMDTVEGLDDLTGYKEREYCVQYRESDWAFISRLCEEEGIFYFFEHGEDQHLLRFGDATSVHKPIVGESPSVVYRDPTGTVMEREYVARLRMTEAVRPGAVHLRDFGFKTPKVSLEGKGKGSEFDDLEIYEFPGEYHDSQVVEKLAAVRLEEQASLRRSVGGESVCHRLCPGFKFTLEEHPRPDFNADYVITDVLHEGFEPQALEQEEPEPGEENEYVNEFRCLPADTVYRPLRVTPRPYIRGTQSATVVCPEGDDDIYTDEYGRVKVRFHWDRRSAADETCSCWIRVSQHSAGAGYGHFWLPRVGHEVIVAFHEGNPDQPHVIGRAYNADNMPPYALPDEKTKSTIKTASSPGAEGFNEIRFEDKKDEEQIFIHAQKQLDLRVGDNRYETVVNDRHLVVENNQIDHVKNERHTKVDADDVTELGADQHLKVTGKQAIEVGGSHSLQVSGDVIEVFGGAHSEETTGNLYLKAMGIVIEATSGITIKCGSNSVVVDPAGVTLKGNLVVLDGQMVNIASGPGSPAMSGTAGSAVSPVAPEAAADADEADPGTMAEMRAEQLEAGEGKYGATRIKALKRGEDGEDEEKTWLEIELVDEDGNPVPGERYEVILPDGETVARGTLDQNGFARVEGLDPGECRVCFPNLDEEAWEPEG